MRRLAPALAALAVLLAAGCAGPRRAAPRPGLTYVGSKPVTLQARLLNHVLVVDSKWDKFGPYHFVIDTGSSVTLVSPDLASRYSAGELPPADEPRVRVRSAAGGSELLAAVALKKIQLGSARFEDVPCVVYDCADLSSQMGVRIDGVLGFPLFRNTVLTLDYPHSRVVLRSRMPDEGVPGEAILFTNPDKTPLIAARLGDREFEVLVDSGSTQALDINPSGLAPRFLFGPTDGPMVGTLAGDRPSSIGRLDAVLRMGSFDIPNPVAEVTQELSSVGGGILSHFVVTFDPEHDVVFFQHDAADSLVVPPLRGTGLSFRKTPAYWKVISVLANSPAAGVVADGDLVSRINGEPVSSWDVDRYEKLVATAEHIDFTVLDGARETSRSIEVVSLVP